MTDYMRSTLHKGIIIWGGWCHALSGQGLPIARFLVHATDHLSLPGVYFKKPKGLLECVPTQISLHYILQRKITLSVLRYQQSVPVSCLPGRRKIQLKNGRLHVHTFVNPGPLQYYSKTQHSQDWKNFADVSTYCFSHHHSMKHPVNVSAKFC